MAEGKHAAPGAYLQVEDLKVQFSTEDGVVRAVDGLTFSVERGKSEVRSTRQTIESELQHREDRFEIKCAEQFNIQDWAALIGI